MGKPSCRKYTRRVQNPARTRYHTRVFTVWPGLFRLMRFFSLSLMEKMVCVDGVIYDYKGCEQE